LARWPKIVIFMTKEGKETLKCGDRSPWMTEKGRVIAHCTVELKPDGTHDGDHYDNVFLFTWRNSVH
jgi:hypothetical protein